MGSQIIAEDIVIVGAGISGLTTALGLHRLGIRSLVLESSDCLRTTGYTLITWPNAWRALDAVGAGDILREKHVRLDGLMGGSTVTGKTIAYLQLKTGDKDKHEEARSLRRNLLLEALAKDLPPGTIRYNSKAVFVEEEGNFKLLHLADGFIVKAKALIGCDGLNSVVARWMGIEKPSFSGRWAIRGYVDYPTEHGYDRHFSLYMGNGFRAGTVPSDDKHMYWFTTYAPTVDQSNDIKENPAAMMKEFVLKNVGKVPESYLKSIENCPLETIGAQPLMIRKPWNILWKGLTKGNVCIAGDALHPMTPDLGQGACSALEDGVVLARCLAASLLKESKNTGYSNLKNEEEDEFNRIREGLKNYEKERRWRVFDLTATTYFMGIVQQRDGRLIRLFRERMMSSFLGGVLLKKTTYDCGNLHSS